MFYVFFMDEIAVYRERKGVKTLSLGSERFLLNAVKIWEHLRTRNGQGINFQIDIIFFRNSLYNTNDIEFF